MRHAWRTVGAIVAVVGGWAPLAFATSVAPGEPMPWVIEAADYTGDIKDQIVRMEARYTIRVIRDGWTEVPLALQGATVTAVKLEKKSAEAHIIPRGNAYVLATSRKGTYKVLVKCSNLLAQDSQFEGLSLGIPRATFSTMRLFVPRKDVELRPADQLYVESEPDAGRSGVALTARLGAADRIELRWRTKPTAPARVEPVIYGEMHTVVTIEEQLARLMSIIEYRVAQGETKELHVRLPMGVNVLNVRGAGIEDWRVTDSPDSKTLTVTLGMVLKDAAYRLIVEGEQTIEGQSTSYTLPELQLIGVKQERGYLAVSRAGSIELAPQDVEGINRVDVKELPDPLRSVMGSAATLAFKYHQHPYRVALALTRHEDHPVLAAIAERGELATVISQQGELLTRATYFIKANKKQFLEALLPEGATLWSCIVDGKSVKPVQGAEKRLLIPLDTAPETAEAVSVELVYFERRTELTRIGHLMLQGPILDVPTTIANWSVYAPKEVKFLKVSGNLERGAAPFEFLDEPFVQLAAVDGNVQYEPDYGEAPATQPASNTRVRLQDATKRAARSLSFFSYEKSAVLGQLRESSDSLGGAFSEGDKPSNVANRYTGVGAAAGGPDVSAGRSDDERFREVIGHLAGRLQETGILPLKIRLPKSGSVYHFNRLMTTQDALTLDATFVHLRMPWVPFTAFGMLMVPIGGLLVYRTRHA